MVSNLKIYKNILPGSGWMLFGIILLSAVATMLESSALVLLIPIFEVGTGQSLNASDNDKNVFIDLLISTLDSLNINAEITNLLFIFSIVAILSVILTWLSNVSIYRLIAKSDSKMRWELYNSVMDLDWTFLVRQKGSEIVKSMTADPIQAGLGLLSLLQAGTAFFAIIVYLLVAAMISWKFTLLTLGFSAVVFPLYIYLVRSGKHASKDVNNNETIVASLITNSVQNAKLFFGQGLQGKAKKEFFGELDKYRSSKIKQSELLVSSRLVFELAAIFFVVLILFSIVTIEKWPISLGLVFIAIFYRLAPRIIMLQGSLFSAINHSIWVQDWLNKVTQYKNKKVKNEFGDIKIAFDRCITINNISYKYPDSENFVIKDISLKIIKGEWVGIVGQSGEGKSTLVDLLIGLFKPLCGEITIDNTRINGNIVSDWKKHIGLVLQDSPIFYGSIIDNITFYSDDNIDSDYLNQVINIADAQQFIKSLPDGLKSVVGEQGKQLSGGQRQRIAIARALYRKPELLILDEATSALDETTTRRVLENLKKCCNETTVIIVSHDPIPLEYVNSIYKISGGKLYKEGVCTSTVT